MISPMPLVSCLCPTYLRPACLSNVIACFNLQSYPVRFRELLVLDDAGQYSNHSPEPGVDVVSVPRKFKTLPEKYLALAGMARGDILVIWEDDDIYLPWHIHSIVDSVLRNGGVNQQIVVKPSKVWSTYGNSLQVEEARGRFHASVAFTRAAYVNSDGWVITPKGDFDQQFIHRLAKNTVVDPLMYGHDPSYVFRWEDSLHPHGQSYMGGDTDSVWLERAQLILDRQFKNSNHGNKASSTCHSKFDVSTAKVFAELVPEVKA